MHIEKPSTLLTSRLYHLISLGSAKRWTLFGICKINPINGIFAQEGVEFLVYEGVSNPINSGFAFLYEAQHCVGSYGLTSCQRGTNNWQKQGPDYWLKEIKDKQLFLWLWLSATLTLQEAVHCAVPQRIIPTSLFAHLFSSLLCCRSNFTVPCT